MEPLWGTGEIMAVVFSPDCNAIASSSQDGTIIIWDLWQGRRPIGPLCGHDKLVWSISFSPDGQWIVSGSEDKTVTVWNVQKGFLALGPLKMHEQAVLFVAFSFDGSKIISGSQEGNFCYWDVATGALVSGPSSMHSKTLLTGVFMPGCGFVMVSPNGEWMATRYPGESFVVWSSEAGLPGKVFTGHTDFVWHVAFSLDSKRIASSSSDKTIRVHTINRKSMGL